MRFLRERRGSFRALWIALLYVIGAAAHTAFAQPAGEIRVTAVHGNVQAEMAGVKTPLYANAVLQLPATIRTGADGAVELRQGPTTIAAAGNTELLIPQSAAVDGLIERVVQLSGNAFYNVGKRETNKLRVETPHLVAVIKGTQFNVAAQADSTTVALYEGRLEVRAPDDSDVVDLHAGEIAIRRRGEVAIRVLRMSAAAVGAARSAPIAGNSSDARARNDADRDGALAASTPQSSDSSVPSELGNDGGAVDRIAQGAADLPLDAVVGANPAENVAASASVVDLAADLGDQTVSAGVSLEVAPDIQAGADLAAGGASVAADVDVGLAPDAIGADVGASVDAGAIAADAGVSADLGGGALDVGADVSAGAGPITADVGASTGVNDGVISADADVGIGAGDVAADVSAGVEVDAAAGQVATNVGLDDAASVDAGVDLQDPGVTVDADVGGVADASLDLGTDGASVDVDTGVDAVDDVVDAVDDVVGGLLNRRR